MNDINTTIADLHLEIKVHTDIEECKTLWNLFSPNNTIFDLWYLRNVFYEIYHIPPHFITAYKDNVPVGMLPLWFDKEMNRYEWYGCCWFEGNTFFVKDQRYVDILLRLAPRPIFLNAIRLDSSYDTMVSELIVDDEPENIQSLTQFQSMDDYLAQLTKKHRYNLKSSYESLCEYEPKVYFDTDSTIEHYNTLKDLNKQCFDGVNKPKSLLLEEGVEELFFQISRKNEFYSSKFIIIEIHNKIVAIDLILQYKNQYYALIGGYDRRYRDISNFLLYREITDAIVNKCALIDVMQADCGWKHKYVTQVPVKKVELM
ncbi:MAG: GNAT family N-acetyltransferase [Candidatus Roizmanbacteria bacterium]